MQLQGRLIELLRRERQEQGAQIAQLQGQVAGLQQENQLLQDSADCQQQALLEARDMGCAGEAAVCI